MGKDFEYKKATIQEIFQNWYSIPNYQRPYVWETDQVEELLDCIKNACEKNIHKEHEEKDIYFLGSIVFQKTNKTKDGVSYKDCELLDGQQRITTIFLILAALRDIVIENKEKFQDQDSFEDIVNTCRGIIYQKKSPAQNIPERLRITFNIREEVENFVNDNVKKDSATSNENLLKSTKDCKTNISIKHIANTLLVAREFFKNNFEILLNFLNYLLTKVFLVYISTENLQDAFQLFTVMNNTGIKLTNSDILKAENLKAVSDNNKQTYFAKEWENMESYFGDDFDNFLSHIRTILVRKKADYSLLKEFNDNIYDKKILERGEQTFEYLKKYFESYQELFDNNNISDKVSKYLTFMEKAYETDYWRAPLLMYHKKFNNDYFCEFLEKVDNKLSLDWIIGLTPSIRIENMNKILKCINDSNSPSQLLQDISLKIDPKDLKTFTTIINDNIYGRKFARYLLLKIDMLPSSGETYKLPPTISIEHILPQTPKENSQWKKDFSDEERELWTDKIGNLVIISRRKNSSQGNSDYKEKSQNYFIKNTVVFQSMNSVFTQNTEWTVENLKKRQTEVINDLEKEYKKNC